MKLPSFTSKAFLAPMAGVSDPALRLICKELGAGLVVTEFKSIHAIIAKEKTIIIAPQAVMEKIPEEMRANTLVMKNWEVMEKLGLKIEAIPMYNLPESAESYHPKGRGNGYVLEKSGARVYISGDTAGIPEMRNLKNIDMAFVAMNLPYTMGVEEAADAVLAFKPKQVYPYHYRTPEGFSNVAEFKELVNKGNPDIEVVQLEWYPK